MPTIVDNGAGVLLLVRASMASGHPSAKEPEPRKKGDRLGEAQCWATDICARHDSCVLGGKGQKEIAR